MLRAAKEKDSPLRTTRPSLPSKVAVQQLVSSPTEGRPALVVALVASRLRRARRPARDTNALYRPPRPLLPDGRRAAGT